MAKPEDTEVGSWMIKKLISVTIMKTPEGKYYFVVESLKKNQTEKSGDYGTVFNCLMGALTQGIHMYENHV